MVTPNPIRTANAPAMMRTIFPGLIAWPPPRADDGGACRPRLNCTPEGGRGDRATRRRPVGRTALAASSGSVEPGARAVAGHRLVPRRLAVRPQQVVEVGGAHGAPVAS